MSGDSAISRLTLLQKGVILIAIPLVVQLLFILMLVFAQRVGSETARRADHSGTVVGQFYRVLASALEAQNALRGFVLTRDSALDVAFQAASRRTMDEIDRLEALVAVDAADRERVVRIRRHAAELLGWLAGTADLNRRGETAGAVERIAKRTVEPLARELAEFQEAASREVIARREAAQAIERRIAWLLAGGSLAAVLLTAFLGVVFSRDIASRLSLVARNAGLLAAGLPLLPPVRGNDEIARVDRAFRNMSAALAQAAEQERLDREELEQSARKLAEANAELRDRSAENELFVYGVSHDLRAPLVNLQGFSQELRRACEELGALVEDPASGPAARERMKALLDEEMAEAVRFISAAVSRLSTVIDAMLRLSRAGRFELRPQVVDVRSVVTKVLDSLHATLSELGVSLVVENLPPCWGDAAAVEQVFANLLDNAIKYLDPSRPGVIVIGSRQENAGPGSPPVYFVRDNGVGIAEADREMIFLPFQRAKGNKAEGEGIGLAVVRRIVERGGGRIWLESTPGQGATFFVSFSAVPVHGQPSGGDPSGAGA